MATRVSKPEPESFDRTPYIFERTRVDDMGESITETFYSVAGRKQEFLFTYPEGRFVTEIVELKSTFVVFRCDVFLNAADERPYRNAYATRELDTTTEIGRRFVECAETAAVGRALANAGIGADALLDDLDGLEQKETGGTPLTKKPADAGQKAGQPPAKETEKPDTHAAGGKAMTDEEAMAVVIVTTTSKSLKGKSFGEALALMKDGDKFNTFLNGLMEKGTPEEQCAAKVVLQKLSGQK